MRHTLILFSGALILAGCREQLPNRQAPIRADRQEAFQLPPDPFGWPVVDRTNRRVGTVFTRLDNTGRVLVMLDTAGLPPGSHGVHIHEASKCEMPAFESAGAHWNWTHKQHGHKNRQGYHAGDLGNLTVANDGKGQATFVVQGKDWDPKSTGSHSLVVHSAPDDDMTDPSGNSGERIACGLFYLRRD